MPKVKESPEKARITLFKATLSKYLSLRGITKEKLASCLLMSRSTFWDKLNNPDMFRLGEIRQLFSLLEFSEEDRKILL